MPSNVSTAVAFWASGEVQVQFQSEDVCDWYRLIGSNGALSRRLNDPLDGGAIPQGLSTRSLSPGIYGFVTERPPSYTVTAGAANGEIRTKSGKDPWPLPPPTRPLEFQNVAQADWDDFHTNEFLVLVGGEADAD